MRFKHADKTWEINWIEPDESGTMLLIGATCLSFKTSGIPADIFFGTTRDKKLVITGKWGSGSAYRRYIILDRARSKRRLLDLVQAHRAGNLSGAGYQELDDLVRRVNDANE